MKETGQTFIAVAIIMIFMLIIMVVGDYFGEMWGFITFIIELIIVGVLLIKLGNKYGES